MELALDKRFKGRHGAQNHLGWIFLRKYEAGHSRDCLRAHHDSNLHTINIPLNEDFEGGGLFFIPPGSELANMILREVGRVEWYLRGSNVRDGCNSSSYFFPYLPVGVGTIYNKTVWHGVTTLTAGSRYTLSFFYDEPNRPSAVFVNERTNPEEHIGLYWVPDVQQVTDSDHNLLPLSQIRLTIGDVRDIRTDGEVWGPGAQHRETASVGHAFCAFDEQTGKILKVWEVTVPGNSRFVLRDRDGDEHHHHDL
eukprot:TRINITY_DN4104_c0_g1_i2.p1 TRINITY_DN4104_c0_g1~~TRINITY_DN4104_c0_g1_i2.p1  ORF type:complete len:252 (+),score=33.64 TRINITY_DN4104_c0_g1_i2:151-906(+)